MDSQLASVLTSGSLDVQNGSQCGEGSGPESEVYLDPEDNSPPCTVPGNLQPCPVKAALTTGQDALSINGKKPEVGGSSRPASQETSGIGGLRQPITVKTGVPVLRSQPIRIKIVVPPRCKGPITNSAISLTKDFAHSQFRGPLLLSAGPVISEKEGSKIHISSVENEGEIMEVTYQKTEEKTSAESFHETERQSGDSVCKERDVLDVKIVHIDDSETPFISRTNAAKILNQEIIKGETTDREVGKNLILQNVDFNSCKQLIETGMEEQTEPLDLSLPKRRDSRERRCGRFLDDSGCESSLIMEVDEYEGEGDRDIVEEDEDTSVLRLDRTDMFEDLSPSFFCTSVLTSLSSIDCDTENLLLIDDQGIPYTLSPDGLKVPQVNASTSQDPQSDQTTSKDTEVVESSHVATLAGTNLSQSLENALNAPSGNFHPSPASPRESPLHDVQQTNISEETISSVAPSVPAESSLNVDLEAQAVLNPPSGISPPTQPLQILANPSINAPILLLSSSSSSSQLPPTPVSLSLPLSVTQASPCASSPMFLLLSSVPSSSGESTSTSTPIAVLDPSTGHLSQITAASAPVSLPLSSGQVGTSIPTLSHPVIRLSPNNAPVILSGMNTMNAGSVLTSLVVPPPSLSVQDDQKGTAPFVQSQISCSESNPGSEAIPAEEVSKENNKPSTFTDCALQTQSAAVKCEPLAQLGSEAEAQSPGSDSKNNTTDLHSEHLPLDDHLYFSNTAAPPSPPIGPLMTSDKLDPLDPLDPLSPAASPNPLGSRRVLYCQLCPRVFFYLSDLERHAITHSQKKPHVCQQCGKAFKRSSHLQRHKHIHTGQRNFVCPICAKRFREAGELQRHQRVHTGEKPYQCQLCHTRFAERNTLRRHTKRKHPYHQAAMEMLSERRDAGGGRGDARGGAGVAEEQESAEWYSSTVSTLENSESEAET